MTHYVRARGLGWAMPTAVAAVLGAAHVANWLESKPAFEHPDRIPAIVLGALTAAILVAPGHHRTDDEVEGSVPRPTRGAELALTAALVVAVAVVAILVVPLHPAERGGLELARDILGLAGLALLGGSLAGARLAWVLPFAWSVGSYFAVTRDYDRLSHQAIPGWLMFPAHVETTWAVAGTLFVAGLGAYGWGGFVPLPRRHPRR